jgi:hypothetical protein
MGMNGGEFISLHVRENGFTRREEVMNESKMWFRVKNKIKYETTCAKRILL